MNSALAPFERPITAPPVTAEELELVRKTIANGATDAELKLFLFDCARQGVHPLDKLLHFTKRGGKYTPITSIDFMRTRAADTGEYAGSDDAIFVPVSLTTPGSLPESARVTVYRLVQGQKCSFTATARWAEYCPAPGQDHMWRRMPHTMLGKCAEALALRKGFPRQLAGLYAREEMDQASPVSPDPPTTVLDTTTGEEVPASLRPTPPDGYHYIASYQQAGEWHEFTINGFDAQGGAMKFATKLKMGELACQAFQQGVPIRIDGFTVKKQSKGEAYVSKLTVWKPAPTDHGGTLDANSIPF